MQDREAIVEAEAVLRTAMLTGDIAALDDLLDDELCFTDQAGKRLSKGDDLAAHRSGFFGSRRSTWSARPTFASGATVRQPV